MQSGFVDDPRHTVSEASTLVRDAVRQVIESLESELKSLSDSDDGSTEDLRLAMQRYRSLLFRLLDARESEDLDHEEPGSPARSHGSQDPVFPAWTGGSEEPGIPAQTRGSEKPERTEKSGKSERTEGSGRTEKPERTEESGSR